MEDLLIVIAKGLVSNPDAVKIYVDDSAADGLIVYRMHVDESDMGKMIGKHGRIAKAVRSIAKSAAIKKGIKIAVEIG